MKKLSCPGCSRTEYSVGTSVTYTKVNEYNELDYGPIASTIIGDFLAEETDSHNNPGMICWECGHTWFQTGVN